MPQRLRLLTEAVEQLTEIVVRIGETRVEGDGAPVVGDRFGAALEVLQRQGEVVVGDRIDLVAREGEVIAADRGAGVPGFMCHAAEVDVRIRQVRIELERALIGGARRLWILVLEVDGTVEPVDGRFCVRRRRLGRRAQQRRVRQLLDGESSSICPLSGCQMLSRSRTTTRPASAEMRTPDSGRPAGSWRCSSLSARLRRRGGTR